MRIITPEFNLIKIGYQGENEAVCVQIGVQNWPELYGAGGTFSLRHQRAGDPDGYPVIVTEEDGTVSWVVSNIDTRDPGYGKATLIYKVNDVIAMSVEYSTLTEASVGENPEPPEPWKPWIDEILEARDEAVEAAEDAHEDANSASQSADDASTEALKAEGYAVGTQDGEAVGPDSPYYEKNGKYYLEEITDELGPIQAHLVDYDNPHQVTPSQIGAIEKVEGAVANDLAVLTADGNLADSGISADYLVPVKAASGSVIEFNSDGAVPLKSALLKGKTAAVNQLADNSYAPTSRNDLTITRNTNTFNVDGTASASVSAAGWYHLYYTDAPYKAMSGHRIYVAYRLLSGSVTGTALFRVLAGLQASAVNLGNEAVFDCPTITNQQSSWECSSGTVFANAELAITVIDLTLCGFTSSETADVATLKAAWLAKYGTPLPRYIPYSAGAIVSNNAVYQLCGHNLFDGTYQANKDIDNHGNITAGAFFISDYIPVTQGAKYYKPANCKPYYYDINKVFVSAPAGGFSGAGEITVPTGAAYLMMLWRDNPVTNNGFVNYPSTATTYEPYHNGGTITADSLNGIGTVYDEQDASGAITRRFGVVDLGSLSYEYSTSAQRFSATGISTLAKKSANDNVVANVVCPKYTAVSVNATVTTRGVGIDTRGYIYIKDLDYSDAATFKTAMSGVYLVYELATPTTDTTTPATLATQKGYNLLRTVSGGIQNAPADIEYFNGLAAVIIEALQ